MDLQRQPNPNLIVVLHYVSKTLWLVLAGVFGLIGYKLYALGVQQAGEAGAKFIGLLDFKLTNAGPGLVVMVFALACAFAGAARSKVSFKSDKGGGVDLSLCGSITPAGGESGDFKIDSSLLRRLTERGDGAFVVVDAGGHVGLQSRAWGAIPDDVRRAVLSGMQDKEHAKAGSRSEGAWTIRWNPIVAGDERWLLISAATADPQYQRALAQADTMAIML
jgi:hypothetical protein